MTTLPCEAYIGSETYELVVHVRVHEQTATAAELPDSQPRKWADDIWPGDDSFIDLEPIVSRTQLPDSWEIRHTPAGRKYYVDHNNKVTLWAGPETQPIPGA